MGSSHRSPLAAETRASHLWADSRQVSTVGCLMDKVEAPATPAQSLSWHPHFGTPESLSSLKMLGVVGGVKESRVDEKKVEKKGTSFAGMKVGSNGHDRIHLEVRIGGSEIHKENLLSLSLSKDEGRTKPKLVTSNNGQAFERAHPDPFLSLEMADYHRTRPYNMSPPSFHTDMSPMLRSRKTSKQCSSISSSACFDSSLESGFNDCMKMAEDDKSASALHSYSTPFKIGFEGVSAPKSFWTEKLSVSRTYHSSNDSKYVDNSIQCIDHNKREMPITLLDKQNQRIYAPTEVVYLEQSGGNGKKEKSQSDLTNSAYARGEWTGAPQHSSLVLGNHLRLQSEDLTLTSLACEEMPRTPLTLATGESPTNYYYSPSKLPADKSCTNIEADWGKFLALSATTTSAVPSTPDTKNTEELSFQRRFNDLQAYLKKCDDSDLNDTLKGLRILSAAARSGHAVALETRAIKLSLEEGVQIKRMKMMNIFGRNGERNIYDMGATPEGPKLAAPGGMIETVANATH